MSETVLQDLSVCVHSVETCLIVGWTSIVPRHLPPTTSELPMQHTLSFATARTDRTMAKMAFSSILLAMLPVSVLSSATPLDVAEMMHSGDVVLNPLMDGHLLNGVVGSTALHHHQRAIFQFVRENGGFVHDALELRRVNGGSGVSVCRGTDSGQGEDSWYSETLHHPNARR